MKLRLATIVLSLSLGGAAVLTTPSDASATVKTMSNKDLLFTIREQVKAGLPADLLIDQVLLPKSFAVPRGSVVEVKWRRAPAEGNAWVLVSASVDEHVKRRAFVRIELVAVRSVLVAQRALAKGETLMPGDLVFEPRVGVSGIALSPEALVGAPVLDTMEVGQVVTGATIGLPAPISRGTTIQVVSRSGTVQVSMQARLETTARPGQSASARIARTHRVVHGRLIDEHTLLIPIGGTR